LLSVGIKLAQRLPDKFDTIYGCFPFGDTSRHKYRSVNFVTY